MHLENYVQIVTYFKNKQCQLIKKNPSVPVFYQKICISAALVCTFLCVLNKASRFFLVTFVFFHYLDWLFLIIFYIRK